MSRRFIHATCLLHGLLIGQWTGPAFAQTAPPPQVLRGVPFVPLPGNGPQMTSDIVTRPTDIAYSAYQSGFYLRAFSESMQRVTANNNDAAAMTLLGELYRQGLGQPLDLVKAAEWYKLAHDRGDTNGTFALAMATLRGHGIPKDEKRAGELLKQAAAKGHTQSAYNLALAMLGSNNAEDRKQARILLETASTGGITEAQHALASLLAEDKNTPGSMARAAALMLQSANTGYEPAEIAYAIMLFNGQGVTADEITAADIFTRAAWRGNAIAQNRIARIFATGKGRTRDATEAAAWHIASAAQGLVDADMDKILNQLDPAEREKAINLASARMTVSLSGSLTSLLR
jgi:uncharacterized protein